MIQLRFFLVLLVLQAGGLDARRAAAATTNEAMIR
jgi:hypothetical protein